MRRRHPSHLQSRQAGICSATCPLFGFILLHLSCAVNGGQTGDEGENREQPGSEVVDNDPRDPVEPEPNLSPTPQVPAGSLNHPGCWKIRLEGATGPRPLFSCKLDHAVAVGSDPSPPGEYDCQCDGTAHVSVEADSCEVALATACEIDVQAPELCTTQPGLGNLGCWPDETGTSWACDCGDEVREVSASDCDEAFAALCSPEPSAPSTHGADAGADTERSYYCEFGEAPQLPCLSCVGASFSGCREGVTCGWPCTAAADCPAVGTGNVLPTCVQTASGGLCVLHCEEDGAVCPDGMECLGGTCFFAFEDEVGCQGGP